MIVDEESLAESISCKFLPILTAGYLIEARIVELPHPVFLHRWLNETHIYKLLICRQMTRACKHQARWIDEQKQQGECKTSKRRSPNVYIDVFASKYSEAPAKLSASRMCIQHPARPTDTASEI